MSKTSLPRHTIAIQILDDLRKVLLGLLMQVRDSDTSREYSVVGMFCRKVCGRLRGKVLMQDEMQALNSHNGTKRTSSSTVVTPW
jgi:hypothetical protein